MEDPQWCTVVSKDAVGAIHFITKSCTLPHSYVCQLCKLSNEEGKYKQT